MAIKDSMLQDVMNSPSKQPNAVRGAGGGLADFVPAEIEGAPAALSEGEFVWPADVVSMIGDGSTEAGARILNQVVKKIRLMKQTKKGSQANPLKDLLKKTIKRK